MTQSLGQTSGGPGAGERAAQAIVGRCGIGQGHPERGRVGKLLSPTKRRNAVDFVRDSLGRDRVSERRAGKLLDQPRSRQRREHQPASDEPLLVRRMVELASGYGRYFYRRATALLRNEGWPMVPAYGCGRRTGIMSEVMTLSATERQMDVRFEC